VPRHPGAVGRDAGDQLERGDGLVVSQGDRRLGLTLDLYQPLRDIEGVGESVFGDNLRRAAATFATARRLGIDMVLVCSNVATALVDL
jgi:4-hydroxyphenylpyruvate dioxygenase